MTDPNQQASQSNQQTVNPSAQNVSTQMPNPAHASHAPQTDLSNPMTFGEEPPMPNPQTAGTAPVVDLTNPIQKGGTINKEG